MDEYGSFEGVVTAADVLQAIVGEPQDAPEPDRRRRSDVLTGTLLLDGAMPVDEIKSRLELPELPAEGELPHAGRAAAGAAASGCRGPATGSCSAGWRFEVVEMDGRRVAR